MSKMQQYGEASPTIRGDREAGTKGPPEYQNKTRQTRGTRGTSGTSQTPGSVRHETISTALPRVLRTREGSQALSCRMWELLWQLGDC